MKELQEVLEGIRRGLAAGEPLVLATVVRVEGSAYRHPGARLLLGPTGPRTGCVSGGCLEGDIQIQSERALADGRPRLLRYDLRGDLDLLWGTGSGCEGVAEVLLEPILPARPPVWLAPLAEALEARRTLRLATWWGPEDLGTRRILAEDEPEPTGAVLVERIRPPAALWILGAGQDAEPLAAQAVALGWRVTVADHRPALLRPERFPGARLLSGRPGDLLPGAPIDGRTAFVLVSHLWDRDREALRLLLGSPAGYIGLLGHRRRGAELLASLAADGFEPPAGALERLYTPLGLDLGGQEPGEIALAALAEIQAVLSGRAAGHLRDRKAPLHG